MANEATSTLSLEEIRRLQEIENDPLTPRDLERHAEFERCGLSVEERIAAIRAELDDPALAAE